jgi:hypothetical protein
MSYKVLHGLENVIAATAAARRYWLELVEHAERKNDLGAGIKLARLGDSLSEAERQARAARNGEEI